MNEEEWMPIYREITGEFGYSEEGDMRAAEILDELLADQKIVDDSELEGLIRGKRVLVVGPAPVTIPDTKFDTVIAADGGVKNVVAMGLKTDMVVSDLDAPPDILRMEIEANEKGAILIIHAHGDNTDALRKYVPEIRGPVLGTTQARATGNIHNFGGFTDGDRAVCLASHFGAKEIGLAGFDFENPVPKDGKDMETKRKKLEWAERIIGMAHPQPYIL